MKLEEKRKRTLAWLRGQITELGDDFVKYFFVWKNGKQSEYMEDIAWVSDTLSTFMHVYECVYDHNYDFIDARMYHQMVLHVQLCYVTAGVTKAELEAMHGILELLRFRDNCKLVFTTKEAVDAELNRATELLKKHYADWAGC